MNSEWAEPPKDQGSSSLATPGAQLAAQREAMGWTVEQIADQLKLAPRQVKALEAGDYAALPNMAVVRGFVRAYAKVVKIDATPLVAMIEVVSPTSHEAAPPRKEIAASFSESRFPSMTGRSSGPAGWLVGVAAVVAVAAAGAYAWQTGLIPATLFQRSDKDASASAVAEAAKPAETAAPIETTLLKPGEDAAPVPSTNVPLISVPPQNAPAAADTAPAAPAPVATPPVAAAPAPVVAAPVAAVAAPAATGHQLVLKVTEDSWVEIRRPGTTPLISRLVKAGSTETFDIKDPALLIVGKPGGVEATLGGAPLALPPVTGGTISRVNIK
ncbi:helix-turn-helix domain-containing protein [Duganella sp. CT11-25]|uniref:helix-turn-helix domain-containing protein n=1 Tax=unclassified Duganella TaxID=2636909 RepID=UPI0039AFC46B